MHKNIKKTQKTVMSQNSSTNTISAANKTKQKVSMTWRCHDKRVMHVMPKAFFQQISSLFISSYTYLKEASSQAEV